MNIFKRFRHNKQLEKDLSEAKARLLQKAARIIDLENKAKELDREKIEVKNQYNEVVKLVREQAEADEVYASMQIIANRFLNKPKADDKPFMDLRSDAYDRLRQVASLQAQQGLQGLAGQLGGALGGVLGSPRNWPYGGLGY